jgi:hypothetical protein
MKRVNIVLSVAGFLLLGSSMTVQGAITCSTPDYNGSYAFITSGAFVQLPPAAAALAGPFAQAGTFTSDALGNVTIVSTASYNGIVLPANVPGTYVINPDCTIVFSLTLPPPLSLPTTFSGVLTNNNRAMSLTIATPPGTVVLGTHVKQDMRFCGTGSFAGAYGVEMGGGIAGTTPKSGVFRRVGRLVSDGAGNFTAVTSANYNGQSVEEDFSGTYAVNGECAITLNFPVGTGASATTTTVGGFLAGHGDVAMVMVTTSGWAVSGTLKAQQP